MAFRKSVVLFERLVQETERYNLQLTTSPFWLKIDPCLSECEKKDLMHAVGTSFGGILSADEKGDYCRIKISLDVQNPLRRGIFINTGTKEDKWLPFKYESFLIFCFQCGRMGHGFKDCPSSEGGDGEG